MAGMRRLLDQSVHAAIPRRRVADQPPLPTEVCRLCHAQEADPGRPSAVGAAARRPGEQRPACAGLDNSRRLAHGAAAAHDPWHGAQRSPWHTAQQTRLSSISEAHNCNFHYHLNAPRSDVQISVVGLAMSLDHPRHMPGLHVLDAVMCRT